MSIELTGDQLRKAELQLQRFLPWSLQVYGSLVLMNRSVGSYLKVFVDRWPEFSVVICKPQCKQRGDMFKVTAVFANDEIGLEESLRKSCVLDWTRYLLIGIDFCLIDVLKAMASEKGVPCRQISLCHMMMLEDPTNLPSIDSSGISLSSLNKTHVDLISQTWKFGKKEAWWMIQNLLESFPSCCVLDAEGKPVSWILTYSTCAIGILHTLPEHRGKGYAKVVVSVMSRRLHAQGYPVYCFIEEGNIMSYSLFKSLGFTEAPSYRGTCLEFNNL